MKRKFKKVTATEIVLSSLDELFAFDGDIPQQLLFVETFSVHLSHSTARFASVNL